MLTVQDALKTLTNFWAELGCLTVTPYNTEVGAGTMNPATVLRVLGPEPWRVAYPEPSVRPDDSRYGENPNRLQQHTQFQVILKPEPGNPQELYLRSLEALGIDLAAHDVRFVEDNWQQPAIGAWGLGWEVWLDGQEITQFTYFQQVGGQALDPVPVELTYGLERILTAVQGVSHFKELAYAPGVTYGEIFGQNEFEMSTYYLDEASIDANRTLYDTYVAEAQRLVDLRLPVPAHQYVLKSSHAFNVLDARGAIATTERANAFATMRKLSREVSQLWVERREELGLPLLDATFAPTIDPQSSPSVVAFSSPQTTEPAGDIVKPGEHGVVVEIGCEELPPGVVGETITAVRSALTEALAASRLQHGEVTVHGTARRIVATIGEVGEREPDATIFKKGPKWQAAFDDEGKPSKALQGFMRGHGVNEDDIVKNTFGKADHVAVEQTETGRDAHEVLGAAIADLISNLRSAKNMRWNDPALSFSRAIRWLVAMRGTSIIDVEVSGLRAGNVTYLHRIGEPHTAAIATADELAEAHRTAGIIVDPAERRASIVRQAEELAQSVGGVVSSDDDLIDEITGLVETPVGVLGSFDPKYLDLPEDILVTVMRKHQRYLAVRESDGTLLPFFITMANGACDNEVVAEGNAAVLKARYEDALFFYTADQRTSLQDFRAALDKLTFESRLGSMKQRAERVEATAAGLATLVDLSQDQQQTLARAGSLVKFDLATAMVIEMSSLAGTMAGVYARRAGESIEVAQALVDAERPRTTSDSLPLSTPGALLALADRYDLLIALFALGAKPTGSSDPYGLRRAALGVVSILRGMDGLGAVSVTAGLRAAGGALSGQGVDVDDEAVQQAAEFVHGRFAQALRDEGVPADLVTAVMPAAERPAQVDAVLADITAAADSDALAAVTAAVVRIGRIVPQDHASTFDATRLTEPAEKALVDAVSKTTIDSESVAGFVASVAPLVDTITAFFDDVMVLAEDLEVRAARCGILQHVRRSAPSAVDWAALDTYLGSR